MTTIKPTNFNPTKNMFYKDASNILVIKNDKKRKLPEDQSKIEEYKNGVIASYNVMAELTSTIFDDLVETERDKLTTSFSLHYKPRLVQALDFIGCNVDLPDGFESIKAEDLTVVGATGGNRDDEDDGDFCFNEAMMSQMQLNDDELGLKKSLPMTERGSKTNAKPSKTVPNASTRFSGMTPDDFENLYSFDPKNIAANFEPNFRMNSN